VTAASEELELSAEVERLVFEHAVHGISWPDSRLIHGMRGFPDWILCGNGRILYRELKTEHATLSPDQIAWRYSILAARGDWSVWRPSDLAEGRVEAEIQALSERKMIT
jgi:hypothetical protein